MFHKQIEEEIIIKDKTMRYVIKDQEGNFVSSNFAFTLTDEGWLYCCFTGITTGFSCYKSNDVGLETVTKELKKLQKLDDKYGFGKEFHIELIDCNSIKMGKSIIKEVSVDIHSDRKVVNL